MVLKERGKGLQRKQALAAIGQGRLIALWDQLFGLLDVKIAQVLLTRQDISDVGTAGNQMSEAAQHNSSSEATLSERSKHVFRIAGARCSTDCQRE